MALEKKKVVLVVSSSRRRNLWLRGSFGVGAGNSNKMTLLANGGWLSGFPSTWNNDDTHNNTINAQR